MKSSTLMAQRVFRKLFKTQSKSSLAVAKTFPSAFDRILLFDAEEKITRGREKINCKCCLFSFRCSTKGTLLRFRARSGDW
jgi:hypothetical protein